MSDRDTYAALSAALRRRLEWDAADGLPGFRYPGPEVVRSAIAKALERPRSDVSPVAEEAPAAPSLATLAALRTRIGDCQRCPLAGSRRTLVFGEGPERARLMFVGASPGAPDDESGRPFLGPDGALLDKMIEAMGQSRATVHLTQLVHCRPPDDRLPTAAELDACRPFLEAHVAAVGPEIIVALGEPAARALLGTDLPLDRLRGTFGDALGARVMPTFHPADLLASPANKRLAWEDLKQVVAALGGGR